MVKIPFKRLLDKWSKEQRIFVFRQFLVVLVSAIVLMFFLQYRYEGNSFSGAWDFVLAKPLVFLYSGLLVLFFMMMLWGISGRPFVSVFITATTIMIISYINISKFSLRGTPLLPEDFQLASEAAGLTKFVDIWGIIRLIIAIILMGVLCIILGYLTGESLGTNKTHRKSRVEKTWWKRADLHVRLIITLVAILGMVTCTEFVRHHDGKRTMNVAWLNTTFTAWNQVKNYDDNGFILAFLYNWNKLTLKAPDGYSEEKMNEITTEYVAEEEVKNESRSDLDYNIILILNESFYDPEIIKEYYNYGDTDITPNLHKIQAKYPSGQMYSVDYGGGTANIEFEVVTGLSNYWANTVPYTDLLPKTGNIPSIATWAKEYGYVTKVIHPYNAGMYKRNIAIKNEGFDEFITEEQFDFTEKEGKSKYINDRSAYNQTIKVLKESDGKQLVSLLTMQNHAPYDVDIYDQLDYRVPEYAAEDWWREWRIANYLQTLHNSDKYLGEFIAELDKFDEKTVVLFYGDHSPGVFDDVSKNENKSIRDLSRLTPYFVYANFEIDTSKKDLGLPTTTPNCLSNTMFNILGAKKPALGYLLDKVCTENPALTPAYFGDGGPFQSTDLSNYELINYDILGGKKYTVDLWK